MEKLEIKAVIKYFCQKGMPPKEIHEYFMETFGKGSPSYSTVKKWAAELRWFPDMAPSDFYLFPKLKSNLRGTQYGSNEDVIEAVNEYLGDQEKAFYLEGMGQVH